MNAANEAQERVVVGVFVYLCFRRSLSCRSTSSSRIGFQGALREQTSVHFSPLVPLSLLVQKCPSESSPELLLLQPLCCQMMTPEIVLVGPVGSGEKELAIWLT